jgi:sugar lactone lactonase YvrE
MFSNGHLKPTTVQWLQGQTDINGSTARRLGFPDGVSVDETDSALYVADYFNNRIQKWDRNSEKGSTIAR